MNQFEKMCYNVVEQFAAGLRAIEKERGEIPLPEFFLVGPCAEKFEINLTDEGILGFPIFEITGDISVSISTVQGSCEFLPVWEGENSLVHHNLAEAFQQAYSDHEPEA